MLKRLSLFVVLFLVSHAFLSYAQPVVEGNFYKYQSERFFVYLWRNVSPEKLNAPAGANPIVFKLEEISGALEKYLDKILTLLRLTYDSREYGRIAVYVYASVEDYRYYTRCEMCSSHVGLVPKTEQIESLVRDKILNPYAVYKI